MREWETGAYDATIDRYVHAERVPQKLSKRERDRVNQARARYRRRHGHEMPAPDAPPDSITVQRNSRPRCLGEFCDHSVLLETYAAANKYCWSCAQRLGIEVNPLKGMP